MSSEDAIGGLDPAHEIRSYRGARWGARVLLETGNVPIGGSQRLPQSTGTPVYTNAFSHPVPLAISMRFAGTVNSQFGQPGPFSPALPVMGGANLEVRIQRGIDEQSQPTEDLYNLTSSTILPVQLVLATRLQIDLRLTAAAGAQLVVETIVAPLDAVELDALTVSGSLGPGSAVVSRIATNGLVQTFAQADGTRRGFIVHNHSTANLYLLFGGFAVIAAGNEAYTIRLGPDQRYESPMDRGAFTGLLTGIWDAADPAGEALFTELH